MAIEDNHERDLWRAVVLQAIGDATASCPAGTNTATARNVTREDARRWLTQPNSDFDAVCGLAELMPHKVRAFAEQQIAEADRRLAAGESKIRRRGLGDNFSKPRGDRRGEHRARSGQNRVFANEAAR